MSQPHFSDDRLIEICFDLAVTSSDRAHLQVCPECEERRSSLAGTLDEIDTAATRRPMRRSRRTASRASAPAYCNVSIRMVARPA